MDSRLLTSGMTERGVGNDGGERAGMPRSVIPDIFSRESIFLFLCPNQGKKQQKDGPSEHLPLANTSRLLASGMTEGGDWIPDYKCLPPIPD